MTGSITKRGKASWRLRFDVERHADGKRKTRAITFRGARRAAKLELARLVTAEQNGQGIDPSHITVADFMAKWERDWAASNTSLKTFERYAELIRLHIVPNIGPLKMQKVRAANLAELYAKLMKKDGADLAPRTVGHVHRVLHRAFGHAAQWGVVPANVVSVVSPPRVQQTEIEILRPEQLKAVREGLEDAWLRTVVSTALGTGLRRGELLALRWCDIELIRNDRARLRVEQSLEQTKAGGLRFKAPKTKHGRRMMALPDYLAGELRTHWKEQQELRLALGFGKAPEDALVFPNDLLEPLSPRALSKRWEVVARNLRVGVTFHALRHTHASQLIASGLDVLTISRRLGHSSPKITLDVYGHLLANSDDRAAQIMDAAFSSAQTKNQ